MRNRFPRVLRLSRQLQSLGSVEGGGVASLLLFVCVDLFGCDNVSGLSSTLVQIFKLQALTPLSTAFAADLACLEPLPALEAPPAKVYISIRSWEELAKSAVA